jgi:hypothetical protein
MMDNIFESNSRFAETFANYAKALNDFGQMAISSYDKIKTILCHIPYCIETKLEKNDGDPSFLRDIGGIGEGTIEMLELFLEERKKGLI